MLDSNRDFFDALSKVLLRCGLFGFALLLIWAAALLSGAVYKLHGPMMGLSYDQLSVIHYCGLALLKFLVLVLYFIPWLSIRLVLRKAKA